MPVKSRVIRTRRDLGRPFGFYHPGDSARTITSYYNEDLGYTVELNELDVNHPQFQGSVSGLQLLHISTLNVRTLIKELEFIESRHSTHTTTRPQFSSPISISSVFLTQKKHKRSTRINN